MKKEEFIKYIESTNKDFYQNLVPEFLSDRFFYKLPLFVIEYCLNSKEAQQKIIKITDTQLDIFRKIIDYALKNNQDWIPNVATYIKNIENDNYSELFKSLEGQELNDKEIENLIFLTSNYGNFFLISKKEDLTDINIAQDKMISMFQTEDPNIILLTKYGIGYDKAKNYLKRYGKDLPKLPEGIEKDFLIDIKNIISGKGTLKRKYPHIEFINNLNSHLRNFYTNIYNKSLYKIDENSNQIGVAEYEGTKIPVYDAGVDFTMSIYSYGLASDILEPENFYEDWNRPLSKSINFCNSIINSASMRTSIKHCVYGFSSFAQNDIQLVAPNDLGTGGVEGNPNVTNFFNANKLIADVEFRIPEEIVNYTRITNNEIYRSRRTLINGQLKRVNPDYIVYLKESSDTNFANDRIWRETQKAAVQFGTPNHPLPIVVIDCEKCIQYNIEKLEDQINKYEQRYDDVTSVRKIIEFIFTLKFGYKNNEKLSKKYLSTETLMTYLNRLLDQIIKTSDIVPNIALININRFIETMELEHIKQLASPYWIRKYEEAIGVKMERPIEIYEALYQIKAKIENKIKNSGYTEEYSLT